MKNIIYFILLLVLGSSCSQKSTPLKEEVNNRQQQKGQKQRPSIDEVFKMDSNNDGLLEMAEVKGPLQRDFSKIDSNNDGFITREELEKAPKPQRGQRRSPNN